LQTGAYPQPAQKAENYFSEAGLTFFFYFVPSYLFSCRSVKIVQSPAMLAMVSVSPPRLTASPTASSKEPGRRRKQYIAVDTELKASVPFFREATTPALFSAIISFSAF
jgi:hypothetical protein